MDCKIAKCNCASDYQDKRYGQGMRVHNPMRKKTPIAPQEYRCTVCGATRQ